MFPDVSLTVFHIVLASLITAAGAVVQGSVGFGYALVAAPFLVLIRPELVPGPILFSVLGLNVMMSIREWEFMDVGSVRWIFTGMIPGTLAGAVLLAILAGPATELVMGLIIFLAVVLSAAGFSLRPAWPSILGAGVMSGFLGTVTSLSGPPLALIFQNESGNVFRSTLAGCFIFGALVSISALIAVGKFGLEEFYLGLWLIPGMAAGYKLSGLAAPYLDRGYTRPAVLLLAGLASAAVIVRSLS